MAGGKYRNGIIRLINWINTTFIHAEDEQASPSDYATFYGFIVVSIMGTSTAVQAGINLLLMK